MAYNFIFINMSHTSLATLIFSFFEVPDLLILEGLVVLRRNHGNSRHFRTRILHSFSCLSRSACAAFILPPAVGAVTFHIAHSALQPHIRGIVLIEKIFPRYLVY